MAYDLQIRRPNRGDPETEPSPIAFEVWKSAVAAIPEVQLCTNSRQSITNPLTRAVIGVRINEGDTEV